MVRNYEAIFGKQTSLPPTFPMIFYRISEGTMELQGCSDSSKADLRLS